MQIDIRTQGFELTDGLREHARKRVAFALDWARHELSKVSVRLSDINGPRGGLDKRCQVRVHLPRSRHVVIEEVHSDLYAAIDRAIDRAGRNVTRRLERAREYPHVQINLPVV